MKCAHGKQAKSDIEAPEKPVCEDCIKAGAHWVALRQCLTCGYIGCCDSSTHQHARKHFNETGHPIIQSLGSTMSFRWCYIDNQYIDWNTSKHLSHKILIFAQIAIGIIAVSLLAYIILAYIPSESIPYENLKCWHLNNFSGIEDIAWRLNSQGVCEEFSTMPRPDSF